MQSFVLTVLHDLLTQKREQKSLMDRVKIVIEKSIKIGREILVYILFKWFDYMVN